MATKLQIRRSSGGTAPQAGTLAKGELAWIDDGGAGTLYIGDEAAGAIKSIGGAAGGDWGTAFRTSTDLLGTATAVNLTMSGTLDADAGTCTVKVPTVGQNITDTTAASTAYVAAAVTGATPDMNAISDTALSHATDCPQASILIWDTDTNKWEDQRIAGDVSVDKDGVSAITSIPNGMVQMGTDTDGNFVQELTAVANQTAVTVTGGAGNAGDSVAVGLAAAVTTPGNLTVTGNLVVNGTTTEVKTNTTTLDDPVFRIGSHATTADRGIEFLWKSGANDKTGFFGMDMDNQRFKYWSDCVYNAGTNIVTSGTVGDAEFSNIYGTIKTAAQNDITSATSLAAVGTITTGTWASTTAPIGAAYGGTGVNSSAWGTGVVTHDASNGWTIDTNGLDVSMGGTGAATHTSNGVLYGNGAGALQATAAGVAHKFLTANGSGVPVWTDVLDGGTF